MHMDQQEHGNKRYTRITFPNKAETFVVIVDDGHSTYKETNSEPFHKFSTKQPRGALPILDTVETAYHKHIGPLQVVQSVQVHGVNALVIKGKFKEGIGYYYFDSTTYKLLKAKVFSGKVELMNIDFIEQELNPELDMSIFKH